MSELSLDLTPVVINLRVKMGADAPITFRLSDDQNRPVDISFDQVKFTARDYYGGAVTIATKTNGPGQHVDPSNGQTTFKLTKADLTPHDLSTEVTWYYEVRRVVAGTNDEIVYIEGQLTLEPGVGAQ